MIHPILPHNRRTERKKQNKTDTTIRNKYYYIRCCGMIQNVRRAMLCTLILLPFFQVTYLTSTSGTSSCRPKRWPTWPPAAPSSTVATPCSGWSLGLVLGAPSGWDGLQESSVSDPNTLSQHTGTCHVRFSLKQIVRSSREEIPGVHTHENSTYTTTKVELDSLIIDDSDGNIWHNNYGKKMCLLSLLQALPHLDIP